MSHKNLSFWAYLVAKKQDMVCSVEARKIIHQKMRNMETVIGTYQNGYVKLEKEYRTSKPVKIRLTFLEEVESREEKGLSLSDFSFAKSRKHLESFNGSFSDAVVEDRDEAR